MTVKFYPVDLYAAITVSFLTIAAGSAFGIWAGVGAFVGVVSMVAASVIGVIFGGINVKTSGPTGPTASLMFVAVAALVSLNISPAHYHPILFISAIILFFISWLPVASWFDKIPHVSIAIFVNGIACYIVYKQIVKLIDFQQLAIASRLWETGIAIATVALLNLWPKISRFVRHIPGNKIISGAFFVMVVGLVVQVIFQAPVKTLYLEKKNLSEIIVAGKSWWQMLQQIPLSTLLGLLFKTTFIITLVTVATAKALDKTANSSRELRNQSIANGLIACIGGVPATIGFIRTKLLQKSGGRSVLSGVLVGVVSLLIIVFFTPVLQYIPTSIFIGILIKAGLSSIDWQIIHSFRRQQSSIFAFLFVLIGTILVVLLDIITVFIGSIVLWYLLRKIPFLKKQCTDLVKCPCVG